MELILTFAGGFVLGLISYFLLPTRRENKGNHHLIIHKLNEILKRLPEGGGDGEAERQAIYDTLVRIKKDLESTIK